MSQTVLVADDSRTIRKVVKMALKVAPFEVDTAGSADEALRSAGPNLALIVLDYHFPEMSGYEVATQFKQNAQTADVPILMLAGERHNFDEARAQEAQVDRVIPKPFDTDTLLDAIVATTGASKKALVKRQKGAPKTESPFSAAAPDQSGPSKEPAPSNKEPAARGTSGGGERGGPPNVPGRDAGSDSGSSKPRFSTPSSGGAAAADPSPSSSGPAQPESGGGASARDESGGGTSNRAETQPDPPGQAPGGGATDQTDASPGSGGGARLDLDLDTGSDPEPAPEPGSGSPGSGSNPRFRSPSTDEESDDSGGSPRRRTPGSSSGSAADPSPAPSNESAPSGGESTSRGTEDLDVSSDELEELVERQVKETVREQLPDLLRKIMGEVFQERVLPKLLDHGKEQVESLVQDQLDRRIHDEVRRQLDELLEEL